MSEWIWKPKSIEIYLTSYYDKKKIIPEHKTSRGKKLGEKVWRQRCIKLVFLIWMER